MAWIVLVGATVNILGTFTYIRRTLRGENKPNRMTFILWTVAPLIACVASLAKGVTWAVVPVFVSALCPMLTLLSSFVNKNAYWKLQTQDYICGALSVLALVLWYLTNEPNVAIGFAILSDGFAAWPTLIKAWQYPETESAGGYMGTVFSASTAFIAAEHWDFQSLAFPAYLILMMGGIALGVIVKGDRRKVI